MKQGSLFVVSGPSGAGKGTICSGLIKDGGLELSVSMTTRKPRGQEIEGINYYFVSHGQFRQAIEQGEMLEWAEIYGNIYGTPKTPVLKKLAEGKDVILEIEMQGAMQVKKNYPQAVLIFILPPSLAELRHRITSRGTESPEQIDLRMKTTLDEIRRITEYDYYIINDDLQRALQDARTIIQAEHLKVAGGAEEIIKKYEKEGE